MFSLILFAGCSKPTERKWGFDDIITTRICFNGGKIFLEPDSDYSNIEIEILRGSSGIRFYINLLRMEAPPWKEDPAYTTISIKFEDQEAWIVHPFLLEGGQKLLLPGYLADTLVQALLDGFSFTIQIGRNQLNVTTEDFIKSYKNLLKIDLEEEVEIPQ